MSTKKKGPKNGVPVTIPAPVPDAIGTRSDSRAPLHPGVKYRRILLKLSGEALMGDLPYGTDPARVASIASQIKGVHERGVEVAIVEGAGNIIRGRQAGAPARR